MAGKFEQVGLCQQSVLADKVAEVVVELTGHFLEGWLDRQCKANWIKIGSRELERSDSVNRNVQVDSSSQ